ncbi:MAG: hypothetical protein D6698_11365 [Gammaproteobacteria bacterium]|nr:MAG: hypothetical protein D6698_11365 [Gammaproteobacteria bacterium]
MKPTSPYAKTPISGRFMGYYVHRSIPEADDDYIINMNDPRFEHRPDLLSYQLYGKPDYWWVFGVLNHWEDPVYDLKVGMTLRAPSRARILNQ